VGAYTDYFVGTESEITRAFSFLFPVIEERIEPAEPRVLINPFTKKPIIDPETGEAKMSRGLTKRTVVRVPSDADADARPTEENRSRMAQLPHLYWKDVTHWEVSALCEVLLGGGGWLERIKLFLSNKDRSMCVYRLPAELVVALSRLDDEDQVRAGKSWRVEDGPEMVRRLSELARLAVRASSGMFLQI
jgi:hypothetical protein